jgi:hypothetical protein
MIAAYTPRRRRPCEAAAVQRRGGKRDHVLLSKSCRLLLLALTVAGCDADWVLGPFSNRYVPSHEVGLASVARYEFREDGTLIRTVVTGCGDKKQEVREEYKWRSDGPSLVIVADVREGDSLEDWHIRQGEACNTIDVERVAGGAVTGTLTLKRGAVCLYELPPCDINCEACETGWCDEPPPECED